MKRSKIERGTPYAVDTLSSGRPGDRPDTDAVRPGYVLSTTRTHTKDGIPRDGLRGLSAYLPVLYLPTWSEVPPNVFIERRLQFAPVAAGALIAARGKADEYETILRGRFERLAAEVTDDSSSQQRLDLVSARLTLNRLDMNRPLLKACAFKFVPLHAVLMPWESWTETQVQNHAPDEYLRSVLGELRARPTGRPRPCARSPRAA